MVETGRPVGRGADDATTVATDPVPEAAIVRPDECLPEQRPHRGADDRGGEGIDPGPDQDEPGASDGLRGPDQGTEVPLGADRLEHDPAEPRPRRGAVQRRPPLGDDGAHAGGARRRGDLAEGFGRNLEGRGARAASVADQPAGDGHDEEFLAVDERLDVEAALHGMDDVPHALDEELPARIPMHAIRLESFDLSERGPGIGRVPIGLDFMRHSPFGEPGARYEEERAGHTRDRSRAAAIRSAGPHR